MALAQLRGVSAVARVAGSGWAHVALIVAAALLLRLAFLTRVPVFLLHDSGGYHLPAWDLAHGLGFDLSPRRTPGYPLFLAGVIRAFGEDLLAIVFVQHLLGIGAAILAYLLARRLFGPGLALLAGLIVGLEGTLLVSEHYIMPETLFTFVLQGGLLAFLHGMLRGSWPWLLAAGVALGVAGLTRPVGLAVIPVLALAALLGASSRRDALIRAGTVCLGAALVLAPWMARNWMVLGTPSLSTTLPKSLLARTAKHDRGFRFYEAARADQYGDRREAMARQIIQSAINQRLSDGEMYERLQTRLRISERETDNLVRGLTLGVIAERPLYFIQGSVAFTWDLLPGDPERLRSDWKTQNARLTRDEWAERVEHLLGKPTPAQERDFPVAEALVGLVQPSRLGVLLPMLAALGALASIRSRAPSMGLVIAAVAIVLLAVPATLDGPVPRYRYPADPLISLLAVGALAWIPVALARLHRLSLARAPGRQPSRQVA